MPIGIQEIRSDGCREFLEPLRRESHVLQLIDVSGVSLYLSIKLSDAVFGSCHPRCELVFFNQALGEAVDESLKRVLLFETQDFESLRILYGSNSFSTFLKLPLQLFGILQKVADLTPYRRFQELSLDLPVTTNAVPSEAITVRPAASIVTIVL